MTPCSSRHPVTTRPSKKTLKEVEQHFAELVEGVEAQHALLFEALVLSMLAAGEFFNSRSNDRVFLIANPS